MVLLTPTTNYPKLLRKQPHTQLHKKRIKCLRINLTKEVKHRYTGKYKMLIKEIEDTIEKIFNAYGLEEYC